MNEQFQQVCPHTRYLTPPSDTTILVRCGVCQKVFKWDEDLQLFVETKEVN